MLWACRSVLWAAGLWTAPFLEPPVRLWLPHLDVQLSTVVEELGFALSGPTGHLTVFSPRKRVRVLHLGCYLRW